MEKVPQKERSRETLALVLIGLGIFWILKQSGILFNFPFFHFEHVFHPIREIFHGIGHVMFSWPMVLIVVGVLLLSGKRSGGMVLLIIGAIFILPKLLCISGAMIVLLIPLILIGLGIAIVARLL